jgi:hypothetical protein
MEGKSASASAVGAPSSISGLDLPWEHAGVGRGAVPIVGLLRRRGSDLQVSRNA